jgi:hypothetical protein
MKADIARDDTPWSGEFWSQVDRSADPSGCWLWRGKATIDGAPKFTIPGCARATGAQIVAYTLSVGPVPAGNIVWRTCLNKRCVNPAHLSCGTAQEFARAKRPRIPAPTWQPRYR